jgi:2-polyprenyl-3-methyl-5-hydroxy-6-metoxy-1,4-benzoquinol methylase
MDDFNGYENVAHEFIRIRGNSTNLIGVATVESWATVLIKNSKVLDIGCGNGIPISKTLINHEFQVYGIDASKTLSAQFKNNFPNYNICCGRVGD